MQNLEEDDPSFKSTKFFAKNAIVFQWAGLRRVKAELNHGTTLMRTRLIM